MFLWGCCGDSFFANRQTNFSHAKDKQNIQTPTQCHSFFFYLIIIYLFKSNHAHTKKNYPTYTHKTPHIQTHEPPDIQTHKPPHIQTHKPPQIQTHKQPTYKPPHIQTHTQTLTCFLFCGLITHRQQQHQPHRRCLASSPPVPSSNEW